MSSAPKTNNFASPWVRAGVLAGILLAADFAFPSGMVDWLEERNLSGWLSAPLAAARAVDSVSAALSVKRVGQDLRRRFGDWVGSE